MITFIFILEKTETQHLLVPTQQWKHQNNVFNMFKGKSKDDNIYDGVFCQNRLGCKESLGYIVTTEQITTAQCQLHDLLRYQSNYWAYLLSYVSEFV